MRYALQQERRQRETVGTLQYQAWNVKCKDLESRRQEIKKNAVCALGVSEGTW